MARIAKKKKTHHGSKIAPRRPNVAERAEQVGAEYAQDQIQGGHFQNWIRDQLIEAATMPTDEMLPLETKADALVVAKNMLQQLEWDAKRDLRARDIAALVPGAESRPGDTEPRAEYVAHFFDGFHESLEKSRDWLADELLEIKSGMRGGRARTHETREVRGVVPRMFAGARSRPKAERSALRRKR